MGKDVTQRKRGGETVCYDIRVATLGAIGITLVNTILLFVFTRIDNVFLTIASIGIVTFLGVLTS